MRNWVKFSIRGVTAPAVVYLAMFWLLQPTLWGKFATHFYCGNEDGYQNIWNTWWTNKSIHDLNASPYFTNYLHHPTGTTLIAHTLAPVNGYMGWFMQSGLGMSLVTTFNTLVVFAFVMTGMTAMWLCWRMCGNYLAALFAGAAFTFCHFHFAHAQNHLQMTSLQWFPLAMLGVYELLVRPRVWKGVAAALAVGLVAMSDFHLTFYVVVMGIFLGLFVLVQWIRTGFAHFGQYVFPLAVFLAISLATTGQLAIKLLKTNKQDPLAHNHDPVTWSTDIYDPFVPSFIWRFAESSKWHWGRLAEPDKEFVYIEHSLYLGWVMLGLTVVAWGTRFFRPRVMALENAVLPRIAAIDIRPPIAFWTSIAVFFFLLSLGPRLHVAGKITEQHGIYRAMEFIFPPLKMGGVPMRLMIVTQLAVCVLGSIGLAWILNKPRWIAGSVYVLLLAGWIYESLPKAQPTVAIGYPAWVTFLKDQPEGAVIDRTYENNMQLHLFFATGHGKPVGEGYISRYPQSVEQKRGQLRDLVGQGRWKTLAGNDWNFKYLVSLDEHGGLKLLFQDGNIKVYSLK